MSDLEWLTAGAEVAYVEDDGRIQPATVDRVGKRDAVINVGGRTERFNITKTTTQEGIAWLRRREPGPWSASTYLGPWDCPRSDRIRETQARIDSLDKARVWADTFIRHRDVESARELQAAVARFIDLHDTEQE